MYRDKSVPASLRPEYIVVKHPLKPTGNTWIMGVKFCNGVGVIPKNSKLHSQLKRSILFKNRKEFSLDWLPKFGFKTKDISLIFGKDVYYAYLEAVGLGPDLKPLPGTEKEETQEEAKVVAFEKEEVEEIKEELKQELEEESEDLELGEPDPINEKNVQEIEEPLKEDIDMQMESMEKQMEEEEEQPSVEEVVQMHMNIGLCVHVKDDGDVCKNKVSKGSPSGNYCFGHIKKDPEMQK